MSKIQDLIAAQETASLGLESPRPQSETIFKELNEMVGFPSDYEESSVEYELLNTLKCAAQTLGCKRMEFIGYIEDLCDIVFDDMEEDSLDLDNLPF